MRDQITLQGADAERFERGKERIAELRGAEPSNAELVRLMMDQFDPDAVVPNPEGNTGLL